MFWCALFVPVRCAGIVLRSVLQGIGMPDKAVIASVYDLLVRLSCVIFGAARFGFSAIYAANPTAWALSALALTAVYRAVFPQRRGLSGADAVLDRGTLQALEFGKGLVCKRREGDRVIAQQMLSSVIGIIQCGADAIAFEASRSGLTILNVLKANNYRMEFCPASTRRRFLPPGKPGRRAPRVAAVSTV